MALSSRADARELEGKFPTLLKKHKGEEAASERMHLQPLTAIHLGGNMRFEIEPNSDMRLIDMFSAIALFILVIASLNYTNLVVARSAKRAVEVGVRKVVGLGGDEIVTVYTMDADLKRNPEPFKQELLKSPAVLGATASLGLPTTIRRSTTVRWDDRGPPRNPEWISLISTPISWMSTASRSKKGGTSPRNSPRTRMKPSF